MKALLLTCFCFSSSICFSQVGFLDETFGDNGRVYTNLHGQCNAVALQPDGKIVAVGTGEASGIYFSTVIRYLADGKVDSSFGTDGIAAILPSVPSQLRDVKVFDDHIFAAGVKEYNVAVIKLGLNGSPDSTFGKDGIFSNDIGGKAFTLAMEMQPDGKILLAGQMEVLEGDYRMLLVRVNADGSRDQTFGEHGKVINNAGYRFNCLAVQNDGKILAGGQLWPTGAGDEDKFYLARYKSDGKIDESFGTHGSVFTDITQDGNDVLHGLSILSDGEIVAAGLAHYSPLARNSYMTAVKYYHNGTLDESFAQNGIAKVIFDSLSSDAAALLVESDNKIILSGNQYEYLTGRSDFALARLMPDGNLDSSFGINGKQITLFNKKDYARSTSSLLQPNGKIVLAGFDGRTYQYLLARYNNDIALPLQFSYLNAAATNKGRIVLNWQTAHENNNNYFSVERSEDSRIIGNSEIARVPSHWQQGTGNQQQDYSYIDNAPLQGINFYRLKQVDKDGKFSYSQVVSATIEKGLMVVLYPNPVRDVLSIKDLDQFTNYDLRITNVKGSVVARTSISNTSSYEWNLERLSEGVYYLSVSSTRKETTVEFVKE